MRLPRHSREGGNPRLWTPAFAGVTGWEVCGRIKSDQHIEWIAQGLDAMSMVKKSITVTDQQEAWIQGQLASGNYATDSELIREAIREKQMRADEIARIRAALTEAEDGGMSDKSPEDIRRAVLADLKEDGGL